MVDDASYLMNKTTRIKCMYVNTNNGLPGHAYTHSFSTRIGNDRDEGLSFNGTYDLDFIEDGFEKVVSSIRNFLTIRKNIITNEEANKIKAQAKRKITVLDLKEVKEVTTTFRMSYFWQYFMEKIYSENPHLEDKQLGEYAQLTRNLSVNALAECYYENMGLKYLEYLSAGFFNRNISGDKRNIDEVDLDSINTDENCQSYFIDEEAIAAVSNESREILDDHRFTMEAFQLKFRKTKHDRDFGLLIEKYRPSILQKINENQVEIKSLAFNLLFTMKPIQRGEEFLQRKTFNR